MFMAHKTDHCAAENEKEEHISRKYIKKRKICPLGDAQQGCYTTTEKLADATAEIVSSENPTKKLRKSHDGHRPTPDGTREPSDITNGLESVLNLATNEITLVDIQQIDSGSSGRSDTRDGPTASACACFYRRTKTPEILNTSSGLSIMRTNMHHDEYTCAIRTTYWACAHMAASKIRERKTCYELMLRGQRKSKIIRDKNEKLIRENASLRKKAEEIGKKVQIKLEKERERRIEDAIREEQEDLMVDILLGLD